MDTPYVREYVEDREITAWFLLDLSPSVDFGTVDAERLKRSVLIDFVTTLARLLTRHGNRVGAVFYGSQVERTIPARGGRIQVLRLVNDLLAQPRLPRAPCDRPGAAARSRPALDQGSLARVRHLRLHQRPGLGALAQRPQPPPRGARGPAVRPARGRAAGCRAADHGGRRDRRAALRRHQRPRLPRRFQAAAEQREATLRDAFRRSGVDAVSLATDDDLVRAIVRMAALRRERRRA